MTAYGRCSDGARCSAAVFMCRLGQAVTGSPVACKACMAPKKPSQAHLALHSCLLTRHLALGKHGGAAASAALRHEARQHLRLGGQDKENWVPPGSHVPLL